VGEDERQRWRKQSGRDSEKDVPGGSAGHVTGGRDSAGGVVLDRGSVRTENRSVSSSASLTIIILAGRAPHLSSNHHCRI